MKKHLQNRIALALVILALSAFFTTCKEEKPYAPTKGSFSDSVSNRPRISYSLANDSLILHPANKNGDILNYKEVRSILSKNRTLALCDGSAIDDGSYTAIYNGASFNYDISNNNVTMVLDYLLSIPANISSTGNTGYVKLLDGFTTKSPLQTKTATPTFEFISKTYNASLHSDFNLYKVTYYINLPYDSFCDYNQYQVRLKISTDCDLIENFSTDYILKGFSSNSDTYQPEHVYAYYDSPHNAIFQQVDVITSYCHYSALGSSSKYIVEYKLASSSTWIPLSSPLARNASTTLTLSPGTYDYRYKGLLYSSPFDGYAPFSPWYQVTIY